MKKSIAFFFSKGPYGNSITKEGLDILLSLSLTMKKISIFFIEDGIFQLLKSQKPEHVLLKNYVSAFKILPLYGVCDFFFCLKSAYERGFYNDKDFIVKGIFLKQKKINKKIRKFDIIFKW